MEGQLEAPGLPDDAREEVQLSNALDRPIQLHSNVPSGFQCGDGLHIHPFVRINPPDEYSYEPYACSDPLRLSTATAPSSKPVLAATQSDVVTSSTMTLGPDFARGWNTLPDELKVSVLSFNLTFKESIREIDAKELFLRHLCMTPEIAGLAKKIYYSTNAFRLMVRQFRFPKPSLAKFIRHLQLETDDFEFSTLQYTAKHCTTRLPNLQSIKIIFTCLNRLSAFPRRGINQGDYVTDVGRLFPEITTFHCKGEVVVEGAARIRELDRDWNNDVQSLQAMLESRFIFKKDQRRETHMDPKTRFSHPTASSKDSAQH
ncbi:hypothetical protein BDV95DRAFT_603107 [Massariosphaeria phaeospora]|uniref:Uncharacterized protein n=1 Tax=Massariosphaeria phaeospora TaxID=100035 RepID=A0A7C8MDE1_9PLEO|nr:hypothetical protein BDV95DRAFT_603107 [Massariosphaeria phaeospora]